MELISYEGFGGLEMRHFYHPGTSFSALDFEYGNIGMICGEHIGGSYFGRPSSQPEVVREINLNFVADECPFEVGAEILKKIGLPLRPGMALGEVLSILGTPVERPVPINGVHALDYIIGETWRYRVCCTCENKRGLIHINVARQDMWRDH